MGHGVTGVTDYLLGPESGNIILAYPGGSTLKQLTGPDTYLMEDFNLKNLREYFSRTLESFKVLVEWRGLDDTIKLFQELRLYNWFTVVIMDLQSMFIGDWTPVEEKELLLRMADEQSTNTLFLTTSVSLEAQLNLTKEFSKLTYYSIDWGNIATNNFSVVYKKTRQQVSETITKITTKFLKDREAKKKSKVKEDELIFYVETIDLVFDVTINLRRSNSQMSIACQETKNNLAFLKCFPNIKLWEPGATQRPVTFVIGKDLYGLKVGGNNTKFYAAVTKQIMTAEDAMREEYLEDIQECQSLGSSPWAQEITLLY